MHAHIAAQFLLLSVACANNTTIDVRHVYACNSIRQLENWVSESAATISSLGARDASVTEVTRIGPAWFR